MRLLVFNTNERRPCQADLEGVRIRLCQQFLPEASALDKLRTVFRLVKIVGTQFAIVEVAVAIVAEVSLANFLIVLY